MNIHIVNQSNQSVSYYQKFVKPVFYKTIELLAKSETLECSLILLDDEQIRSINHTYRNKDMTTDVISFVASEGDNIGSDENYIGDIFINMDAVKREAEAYSHSRKREFCFLLAHGLLHCLGYDHQSKKEEEIMFDLQERILYEIAPRSTAATRQQI